MGKQLRSGDGLLKALAMGPSRHVKSWKRYNINGFKFRAEGDVEKVSMNNGVCVSSYDGIDYYGFLEDVVELTYNGDDRPYTTTLFKCKWIDITKKGTVVDKNYKLVEVNPKQKLIGNPFVLSYQVNQAYYTTFPNIKKIKIHWLAAFKVQARSNIDAPVNEIFFQENRSSEPSILSSIDELDGKEVGNNGDDVGDEVSGDDMDRDDIGEAEKVNEAIDDDMDEEEEDDHVDQEDDEHDEDELEDFDSEENEDDELLFSGSEDDESDSDYNGDE